MVQCPNEGKNNRYQKMDANSVPSLFCMCLETIKKDTLRFCSLIPEAVDDNWSPEIIKDDLEYYVAAWKYIKLLPVYRETRFQLFPYGGGNIHLFSLKIITGHPEAIFSYDCQYKIEYGVMLVLCLIEIEDLESITFIKESCESYRRNVCFYEHIPSPFATLKKIKLGSLCSLRLLEAAKSPYRDELELGETIHQDLHHILDDDDEIKNQLECKFKDLWFITEVLGLNFKELEMFESLFNSLSSEECPNPKQVKKNATNLYLTMVKNAKPQRPALKVLDVAFEHEEYINSYLVFTLAILDKLEELSLYGDCHFASITKKSRELCLYVASKNITKLNVKLSYYFDEKIFDGVQLLFPNLKFVTIDVEINKIGRLEKILSSRFPNYKILVFSSCNSKLFCNDSNVKRCAEAINFIAHKIRKLNIQANSFEDIEEIFSACDKIKTLQLWLKNFRYSEKRKFLYNRNIVEMNLIFEENQIDHNFWKSKPRYQYLLDALIKATPNLELFNFVVHWKFSSSVYNFNHWNKTDLYGNEHNYFKQLSENEFQNFSEKHFRFDLQFTQSEMRFAKFKLQDSEDEMELKRFKGFSIYGDWCKLPIDLALDNTHS